MSDLLDQVKAFISISDVNRDNTWFKLFSKVAVATCFLGSVVCFSTTYIGDPIVCSHTGVKGISDETIESYCWIHGTYHIKPEFQDKVGCKTDQDPSKVSTQYYQWVVFMLIIHGLIFALPNAIWKIMERGLMKEFGTSAKSPTIMADKNKLNTTLTTYVDYFLSLKGETTAYTLMFFFCELLNIGATVSNFYIANAFLNKKFKSYGHNVVQYLMTSEIHKPAITNPMCDAFPTVVSCNFASVTIGGTTANTNDALCILSQNIINEKIYLVLWFLIQILFVLSAFHCLYRLVLITVPASREFILRARCKQRGSHRYTKMHGNIMGDYICRLCLGDWFFLNQLSSNCHPLFFVKFMSKLAHEELDSDSSSDKLILNCDDIEMNGKNMLNEYTESAGEDMMR